MVCGGASRGRGVRVGAGGVDSARARRGLSAFDDVVGGEMEVVGCGNVDVCAPVPDAASAETVRLRFRGFGS